MRATTSEYLFRLPIVANAASYRHICGGRRSDSGNDGCDASSAGSCVRGRGVGTIADGGSTATSAFLNTSAVTLPLLALSPPLPLPRCRRRCRCRHRCYRLLPTIQVHGSRQSEETSIGDRSIGDRRRSSVYRFKLARMWCCIFESEFIVLGAPTLTGSALES